MASTRAQRRREPAIVLILVIGFALMKKVLLAAILTLALGQTFAQDSILRPDHPDEYAVREGDTLWGIASMFLTDAWLWPEIWYVNPEIKDPHLIFPGDTIVLMMIDGEPRLTLERGVAGRTTKLSPGQPIREGERYLRVEPRVRSRPITSSIPAIPLDSVAPLLTTGRIVERDTLDRAPHILAGKADRLVFGPGDEFYARGNWVDNSTVFGIFRPGEVYVDPDTREVLGYEAIEVGAASVEERADDIYTMSLMNVKQDVRVGDRLLPTEERRLESTFYPAAPGDDIDGVIMTILGGLSRVGRNDVVAINRGERDGLEVGHVLAVHKAGAVVRDAIARERVQLPSERAGLMMVFRTFDRMAYGLILQTTQPLVVGDLVQNP